MEVRWTKVRFISQKFIECLPGDAAGSHMCKVKGKPVE
jgi:hypothetical protein